MIKTVYRPTFFRHCKKLPNILKEEIKEKIELFSQNPKHPFLKTHKLKGHLKGCLSFSVNYQYRVIFYYKTKNVAVLLGVGTHDLYNDFD